MWIQKHALGDLQSERRQVKNAAILLIVTELAAKFTCWQGGAWDLLAKEPHHHSPSPHAFCRWQATAVAHAP
jgi:hypothetical protein